MRFSGMPQRPNPPSMSVAPEGMSATAAAADSTTLFNGELPDDWTDGAG